MRTLFLVLNLLLILSFQAQENKVTTPETITETGWPKDIDGLITHLNNWDKQELAIYEQTDLDSNIKTSGETNGWIIEHKRLLKDMGATVVWNKRKMEYQLVKTQ